MAPQATPDYDYDYIIIGSGFGGSVSALRLAEKGYKVLVLEKGKWLKAEDFPKTNWNLKRWLWVPAVKFFGLFKLTPFRHVTVLSGVGVGGGSLVYASTLPVPKEKFFQAVSWAHLADWQKELSPHYDTALKMLGANPVREMHEGDIALQQLAKEVGRESSFEPTQVAVFFGESGQEVPDPYFDGKGPARTGCIQCGGCMLGCRYNAKNTLDKNYLHLAQGLGATIQAESEVVDVRPLGFEGKDGYEVCYRSSTRWRSTVQRYRTKGVVFSGGVLGTIQLLLKLKVSSLPGISDRLGYGIRTNSEAIIAVTSTDKNRDFSRGVAIGSIMHPDDHSHLEPVRYSAGAGFWRIAMWPMVTGGNALTRVGKLLWDWVKNPIQNFKVSTVDDWAKRTQILLFMQTIDSTLKFTRGWFGMRSILDKGKAPSAFMPEAQALGEQYGRIVNGKPTTLLSETLMGIPTTAHILGGATMGTSKQDGVIDKNHRVFGYHNMYVCDGSAISANIGVNPSLTITALTERAMSQIASKQAAAEASTATEGASAPTSPAPAETAPDPA